MFIIWYSFYYLIYTFYPMNIFQYFRYILPPECLQPVNVCLRYNRGRSKFFTLHISSKNCFELDLNYSNRKIMDSIRLKKYFILYTSSNTNLLLYCSLLTCTLTSLVLSPYDKIPFKSQYFYKLFTFYRYNFVYY